MPKLPDRVAPKREDDVKSEVRAYLASERIINWLNPVGSGHAPSGHYVIYGLAEGSADVIACVPTQLACPSCGAALPPVGRFVGIETKHAFRGVKSDFQKSWASIVREAHGVVGFARSVDEARHIIAEARLQW